MTASDLPASTLTQTDSSQAPGNTFQAPETAQGATLALPEGQGVNPVEAVRKPQVAIEPPKALVPLNAKGFPSDAGMPPFPNSEFTNIYLSLKRFPSVYNKFWAMARPHYSRSVPTAGVYFDKDGRNVGFAINPEFWATLNDIRKEFIICHEIAHVMFLHGQRAKVLVEQGKEHPMNVNIAMDLVVNQFVCDSLGFLRKNVDPPTKEAPQGSAIWLDRLFKPEDMVFPNRSFEYYWGKIKEKISDMEQRGLTSMDDHSFLKSFDSKEFGDKMGDNFNPQDLRDFFDNNAAKKINQTNADGMAEKQKEFVQREAPTDENAKSAQGQQAGSGGGREWMEVVLRKQPPKKKWEEVIQNVLNRNVEYTEIEQWRKRARLYKLLPKKLYMPCEDETNNPVLSKTPIWLFQDTSGSCVDLAPRFFKAAKSINPERFDVKMHCFDTSVYKTDLKSSKLYGFGGTTFTCIEQFVQSEIKKTGEKYPICFLITDGYGDHVQPEFPSKWHVFLSTESRECFPNEVKIFNLSDFE